MFILQVHQVLNFNDEGRKSYRNWGSTNTKTSLVKSTCVPSYSHSVPRTSIIITYPAMKE